jgi:type I restriction enzyme S subunit
MVNKNIPKLRFEEFSKNWESKKLGDISSNKSSSISANRLKINTGKYKVYGASGYLKSIDFYTENEKYISIVKDGAGVGRIRLNNSKTSVLGTLGIINTTHFVDIAFLYLLLNTINFNKYINGSTIPHIYYKDYKNEKLSIPSLKEQIKIANFLTIADKKIQQFNQKQQLLQNYKNGVMQQMFSQKIRFKNDDCDLPDWENKKLDKVFNCIRGKGLSKSNVVKNGNNKCILYGELYTKYSEVIVSIESFTNIDTGVKSKIGDLLIPCSTTTTGVDLANVTTLNEKNVLLGGDISILRFKGDGSSIFFAYFLSHYKKYDLAKYAQGSTIIHLSFNHFKKINIKIPKKKEQTKIANFLSVLDKKINLLIQQTDISKDFKKSLLQKMFV